MSEALKKIFSGDRTMNVVCFGSGSGTNIEAILQEEKENDGLFKVAAIVTNKECRCLDIADEYNIPKLNIGYKEFKNDFILKNGDVRVSEIRKAYFRHVRDKLLEFSDINGTDIDLICLAGYMLIVDENFIDAYKDRIINVHPSDLRIMAANGGKKRKYTGENAVYDAIKAGEQYTRSSIHIVTKEVDGGEILVVSNPCKVEGLDNIACSDEKLLKEFASKHQDKQKKECDWPAYRTAVRLIAQGKFSLGEGLDGQRKVYFEDSHIPNGYELT